MQNNQDGGLEFELLLNRAWTDVGQLEGSAQPIAYLLARYGVKIKPAVEMKARFVQVTDTSILESETEQSDLPKSYDGAQNGQSCGERGFFRTVLS